VNWSLALRKDQTMKRKRHTEEQIIAIRKEHEAGMKTADLCRKHGISEASASTTPPKLQMPPNSRNTSASRRAVLERSKDVKLHAGQHRHRG
jgi:hypothetical protein